MDSPLVSIIIPVYNSEKYLAETIASAIRQTWENKEIIVIDDGSTDNSLLIAESFANEYIKVFSQPNKGASAARNKGLLEAKGDYIQFLDGDDLLMHNKIELQLNQLSGKPYTLVACPVADFYKHEDILNISLKNNKPPIEQSTDTLDFLLNLHDAKNKLIVPIHAWLTPASLIKKAGPWDETLSVNDDGEFFCRVVLASTGVITVNDTLCYYRKYYGLGASLSGRKDLVSLQSQYQSLLLIHGYLKNKSNNTRIDQVIAQNLTSLLVQTYPAHKQLANIIVHKIKELGGTNFLPILGGSTIEIIKKAFGWKIARRLQYYLYK